MTRAAPLLPMLALGLGLGAAADEAATGLRRDVTFDEAPSWSSREEMRRRLMSPIVAAAFHEISEKQGKPTEGQLVDLADERFLLYVPASPPPGGYGLMVFVPPWETASLPADWIPILDRMGVIFVSAARSGNLQNTATRREPLALIAAANVMRRYPIDPDHVFIGGFSGGSRVAERLALGYPDLFRGALLNAGSDRLGLGDPPVPVKDLFERFQASSRVVFVTGQNDAVNLTLDSGVEGSFGQYCVFATARQVVPGIGHDAMPARSLGAALSRLLDPVPADPDRLGACRQRLRGEAEAALEQVRDAQAKGHAHDAAALLWEVDRRFGGLAAPASLDLAR